MGSYFSWEQLTSVQAQSDAIAELKQFLTGSGFNNINTWLPGTFQYDFLQLAAFCYVAGQSRAQGLALGAIVPTSSGSFLTNLASSFFNIQRAQGQQTQGQLQLVLAPGKGPFTVGPGQLQVTYNGTYTYTNNTTITLTGLSPVASAVFTCTNIGSASDINVPTANVSTPSLWTVPTTYNGVTVTNPPIAGTQSWIYIHGADTQADNSLQLQCQTQWANLATVEAVSDRVISAIVSASNGTISEVTIDPTQPAGPGTVTAYCATALNVAAPGDIAAVSGSVQSLFMNGTNLVKLLPATPLYFGSGGNNTSIQVFYKSSANALNVSASCVSALYNFISSVPVGGANNAPIYFGGSTFWADVGQLEDVLYNVPGVRNVVINNRNNIAMSPYQKLITPVGGWVAPVLQLTASQS